MSGIVYSILIVILRVTAIPYSFIAVEGGPERLHLRLDCLPSLLHRDQRSVSDFHHAPILHDVANGALSAP